MKAVFRYVLELVACLDAIFSTIADVGLAFLSAGLVLAIVLPLAYFFVMCLFGLF